MVNPNSPHLPDRIIWLERAVLVGDAVSQMLFGIVFVVFLQIMHALLKKPAPQASDSGRRKWPLIIYTVMDLHSLQLMFVDNREFPGGPTAYALSQYGKPITVVPNVCAIVSDWLAAGLLLYRCLVIFHLKFYIVALPILMYLGSVAMGCLVLFRSSRPHAHLWTQTTVNFGIPYFTLSAALNVTITAMISVRLLMYRRSLQRTMGPGQYHTQSIVPITSITAMLIESSAMYTAVSVLFIVPYGLGSYVSNMFLPNLTVLQILAPLLIILRVAKQRGWDSKTAGAYTSTLRFQSATARSKTNDSEIHFDAKPVSGKAPHNLSINSTTEEDGSIHNIV
ncbi:hypothetical protein BDZ94DRAFT_1256090 [Collybia nuda]|uniref:Uncharacterized protein n=1 Tax=Collybia nuda TaxID=64659 RepID=A0A9P5YBD8_9AGAR|nr:hypothetical protein BDZ94DRAFT_1256090 [Collybia nuda]